MIRLVIALFIASLSLGAEAQSKPPVDTRAYAPENIGSLPVSDQIRVIEKEYREQSRGRQIPDDQLDFYLDQIKYSRWTFSRIKNDIAVSLRGSSGNWNPPPGGNWNPGNVICSSNDRRYNECRTPFRGRARLVENISNTRCVEGRNWGSRQGLVWVDDGCRGRFVDSGTGWGGNNGNWNNGQTFRCESDGNRYHECRKPYSGNTVLVRQLSSSRCTEGYSWGEKRDIVWVSNGCRGEFQIRGSNGGSGGNWNNAYTVTCSSYNGAFRTCAWDRNRGEPQLIERLAGRCSEWVDWGYDNRGLWVKNSCSARFGAR